MDETEYDILQDVDESGYFIELKKVFDSTDEAKDYAKHLEIKWG